MTTEQLIYLLQTKKDKYGNEEIKLINESSDEEYKISFICHDENDFLNIYFT